MHLDWDGGVQCVCMCLSLTLSLPLCLSLSLAASLFLSLCDDSGQRVFARVARGGRNDVWTQPTAFALLVPASSFEIPVILGTGEYSYNFFCCCLGLRHFVCVAPRKNEPKMEPQEAAERLGLHRANHGRPGP